MKREFYWKTNFDIWFLDQNCFDSYILQKVENIYVWAFWIGFRTFHQCKYQFEQKIKHKKIKRLKKYFFLL